MKFKIIENNKKLINLKFNSINTNSLIKVCFIIHEKKE
jgi:hypothetical protein